MKTQIGWVKILTNGLITIPKQFRDKIGMKDGDIAKAYLMGNKIVIEPQVNDSEMEVYSDAEINQWLVMDTLPEATKKKMDESWKDTE